MSREFGSGTAGVRQSLEACLAGGAAGAATVAGSGPYDAAGAETGWAAAPRAGEKPEGIVVIFRLRGLGTYERGSSWVKLTVCNALEKDALIRVRPRTFIRRSSHMRVLL